MSIHRCAATLALALSITSSADAALTLLGSFGAGIGELVGAAYDPADGAVWVYGSNDADIRRYSSTGTFLSSIPRPGESSDDFDLDFAPEALTLAGTAIPAGSLLVINGETDAAEIYAVDKVTGAVLASLNTAFGMSHVVGGAYHPGRGSFFLVQDRVPTGTANDSVVAEINPLTGSILATFKIDDVQPGYTINFGDVDVTPTGTLLFVSSDETPLAEFTPGGAFVQLVDRPAGLSSLSGLGLNNAAGEAWVTGTGGTVWRLGGIPVPEPTAAALVLVAGVLLGSLGRRL